MAGLDRANGKFPSPSSQPPNQPPCGTPPPLPHHSLQHPSFRSVHPPTLHGISNPFVHVLTVASDTNLCGCQKLPVGHKSPEVTITQISELLGAAILPCSHLPPLTHPPPPHHTENPPDCRLISTESLVFSSTHDPSGSFQPKV